MDRPVTSKWLLNPVERASEILFGLIMTLSFTCSISIANAHHAQIRQLLIETIGCSMAWGLVDATMYLIGALSKKNRNKLILNSIQHTATAETARTYISEALPP